MLAVELVTLWSYRHAPRGGDYWLFLALHALGLGALAFCLLERLRTGQRSMLGANLFVLADNSAGLQIADRGATKSRGEQLKAMHYPKAANWQYSLADNFECIASLSTCA